MTAETPLPPSLAEQPVRPFLSTEAGVAQRVLWIGLAALLVIWLVRRVEIVAVAAFIGFGQTALLWPVVKRLRRFLPGGLAALLVVSVYAAVIVALLWFIVVELTRSWSSMLDAVIIGVATANLWFVDRGWAVTPALVQQIGDEARGLATQVFSGVGQFALTGVTVVSTMITIVVVATFATLFCLASGDQLWNGVLSAVHPARRARVDTAMREGFRTARWWMLASTATGFIDAVFIGLGLAILGVPFVVPIMVLTFILGFIPMIGATTAGAIAVGVALFSGGLSTAIWALVIVLLVQQIEGNVLSPLLLSRAMQFHPVITLLLATGGGLALGLAGLFLAVPVAGVLVALRRGWFAERRTEELEAEHPPEPDPPLAEAEAESEA
ncbi:MAG: AI-2E family transporter [Actinobacteria bacterium]|nr:AI-2E family transporter [Actinomycetota bacterium]